MRIKREDLLSQLESVRPGLSSKEIIEQSSCFVFKDKHVITYNGEEACSHPTDLDIEGAVQAAPLLAYLNKLAVDWLECSMEEGELQLKHKSKKAGVRMESNILLPVDSIEKPKKWKPLPDDFLEAVDMVAPCAGDDESQFVTTCLHIHPDYIEAMDNFQIARYPMSTNFKKECLVRQESLVHITSRSMKEVSETESWVHFRNNKGMVMSCRRSFDDYPDLDNQFDIKGSNMNLPKGIAEAADIGNIFSSENADNNQLTIKVSPRKGGRMHIEGRGALGWASEIKKLKYKGDPLEFKIAPEMLIKLIERHNECVINSHRLKVDAGKFVYISVLGKTEA